LIKNSKQQKLYLQEINRLY